MVFWRSLPHARGQLVARFELFGSTYQRIAPFDPRLRSVVPPAAVTIILNDLTGDGRN